MKITPKKVGALSAALVTAGLIGTTGVAGASSCNWNNNRYCHYNNNWNHCNYRNNNWNSYSYGYGYNNWNNNYWW